MIELTQTNEVLKHLQSVGSITSIDAIYLYGATRISVIGEVQNEEL
jgi:hypothetical protein